MNKMVAVIVFNLRHEKIAKKGKTEITENLTFFPENNVCSV